MDPIKEKLIQDLAPNVLSPELIEKEQLIPENLFEVKIGQKILGPFSGSYLKTALTGKDVDGLMVKKIDSIIWIPFQQHSHFFTGEVKPVTPAESERREFYLLVNGRKIGPYKSEDIEYKFKSGELLFTDLISDDEGLHWCKLYEMPHVDLRRHIGSELPPSPTSIESHPNLTPEVLEQIGEAGDLVKMGMDGIKEKYKKFADMEQGGDLKEKTLFQKSINLILLVALVAFGGYLFEQFEVFKSKEREPIIVEKKDEVRAEKSNIPQPEKIKIEERVAPPPPPRPSRTRVENTMPKRPPRYPAVPQPDLNAMDNDYLEQDEEPVEPEDDYFDEETPKPKKPAPSRARSRPKPFEDNLEEPADDFIYD